MFVKFEEVKVCRKKCMKCADGKWRTRRKTFTNTVNPYNKNGDGTVRTMHEIYVSLNAEADEWMRQPITDY